jgi:hypothetical protein
VIPLPAPNTITRPYRGLSMQEVDLPLHDEQAIVTHLVGREVYRRTAWLVLRNGADCALVEVAKQSEEPLFPRVVEARVLSGPNRTRWVESPHTDVGNATALAAAAATAASPHIDAYVVTGRYEHVNAIWQPHPVRIRVTEVVPPEPAKLFEMAGQAVAFDEDLPPIELVLDPVELTALAGSRPSPEYLLPCRGCGADIPGTVSYLDTRPEQRRDWVLLGCERSLQFHRHFYGDEPPQVDFCPTVRARSLGTTTPVLSKCCLLERGVQQQGTLAVVPWGANLDEVRLALRLLTGLGPVPDRSQVGEAFAR